VTDDVRRLHADSGWEWEVRGAVVDAGLRPWTVPFPWRAPDGRVNHLDLAFPAGWVYIDCIGDRYHAGSAAQADRRRWNAADLGGWRTVWAGWERRDDLAGIVADVRRRLAEADPARPPAQPAPCECRSCRRAP
jgi:hypothetical protein